MGVNLKDLFERKEITLDELSGKILAIDAYNMLYQFLTTIRTPEGQLLTDSKGNITSHLIGLFSRTCAFLEKGIKPVFVFDGKPPELKIQELHRRADIKREAAKKYQEAEQTGDINAMKKFGARTARLEKPMVEDAKKLVQLLGLPAVQAPSEGEAQCAHMAQTNAVWAVASQDYDSLLHGTPKLVQNLSITGRRKIRGAIGTVLVSPALIKLQENLTQLAVSQDQLILLALLVGTDYNYGGIHGIGPKKALKIVKEHKNIEAVESAVNWKEHYEKPLTELYELIKNIPVTDEYDISFQPIDAQKLTTFLVDEHDFGAERVKKTIDALGSKVREKSQKGLGAFL
ncbi:MAG: flap endonuclease-1 [Candidatus Aenigmarchaeota archaeon]|nr:flap endonuclease-1 [Candidatus Aenigmarchaeota archaeon]